MADNWIDFYSQIFFFFLLKCRLTIFTGEDDDDIELNYMLDRHLEVSLAMIDEFHQEPPEIEKDPLEDITFIPHTKMSWEVKAVLRGPKQHFHIRPKSPEETKLVDHVEIILDENKNDRSPKKKENKHQRKFWNTP